MQRDDRAKRQVKGRGFCEYSNLLAKSDVIQKGGRFFMLTAFFFLMTACECGGVSAETPEYEQKVICYFPNGEPDVHKGFSHYYIGSSGTTVKYDNGDFYDYSVAVSCKYTKKEIKL